MDQMIFGLGRLNHAVAVAARSVAAVLLVIMTAIVLLQVFFRYGLNNSLSWTEELAKIMMVWMAFLVAPWALRQGVNVSIDMFVDALPRRLRLAFEVILQLLILWIVGVFFLESLDFWKQIQNKIEMKLTQTLLLLLLLPLLLMPLVSPTL